MKRLLDIVISLFALALFAPVMTLVACAVLVCDGRPILFQQERVGRYGVPFKIYKFRTMTHRPKSPTHGPKPDAQITVAGDTRVTPLGRTLRRTKLDELPQLLNVLRGEMSLVGPRPEVPQYVAKYTAEQQEVLNLRPGITDLATLRYRHESEVLARYSNPDRAYVEIIMPEKIRMNLEYSKHATPIRDLNVLVLTAYRLFT